jgi:hypothetical protein
VQPTDDARRSLARRLRALRELRWPDLHVTQHQLAEAFGDDKPLSLSLISSWESPRQPTVPPLHRLNQYSWFFATRRSVSGPRARLLAEDELTPEERAERELLYEELARLRHPDEAVERMTVRRAPAPGEDLGGPFHFADGKPVTIVCSRLPDEVRARLPYTDPRDPDYIRSFSYADNDALIELYGHVRAVNPTVDVRIRTADVLEEDDYTTHLVLLGGVDWNDVTAEMLDFFALPVRQVCNNAEGGGFDAWFEVDTGDGRVEHRPTLGKAGGREVLREDIAHFLRAPNPFNQRRTVTICNGMYGRGVYGAVRALTDQRFRDRNEEYLGSRFGGSDTFGILMRVRMAPGGKVITPDWTRADTRLYEWPEATS